MLAAEELRQEAHPASLRYEDDCARRGIVALFVVSGMGIFSGERDRETRAALSLDPTGSNPPGQPLTLTRSMTASIARPSEVGSAALQSFIQHMAERDLGDRGRMSARPSEAPKGDRDEGKCDRHGGRRMPRNGLWGRLRARPVIAPGGASAAGCGWRRAADRRRGNRGRPPPPSLHGDAAGQCDAQARGLFAGRCWTRRDVHDAAHDGCDPGERHTPEPAGSASRESTVNGSGRLVEFSAAISPPVMGGR